MNNLSQEKLYDFYEKNRLYIDYEICMNIIAVMNDLIKLNII